MKKLLTILFLFVCSNLAAQGFLESAISTTARPLLTPAQIAQFLPTGRGSFKFPAPYNTEAYRITIPADCPGNTDCVSYVGYSYWANMNNSAGSNTMYLFVTLNRNKGGEGPTLFSLNKTTGIVTKVGALFAATDNRSYATGEGWYFSAVNPTMLYVTNAVESKLTRYDVISKITTTVFDITGAASLFGTNRYIWQVHSSNDGIVHSFTVRDKSTTAQLGAGVYLETTKQFKFYPTLGGYDECQIDKSGRWLMIKEQIDGLKGEDNRIIDLQTGVETSLLDEKGGMGHSDMGYGYVIGADNFYPASSAIKLWQLGTSPVGPGTVVYRDPSWASESVQHLSWANATSALPNSQYACGSGANATNGPRVNEIVCFKLDGSLNTMVVAPVMTDMNAAGGGDSYSKVPKGNLDITGEFFIWTSNTGGSRLDAFVVKVPPQFSTVVQPPIIPPVISDTTWMKIVDQKIAAFGKTMDSILIKKITTTGPFNLDTIRIPVGGSGLYQISIKGIYGAYMASGVKFIAARNDNGIYSIKRQSDDWSYTGITGHIWEVIIINNHLIVRMKSVVPYSIKWEYRRMNL